MIFKTSDFFSIPGGSVNTNIQISQIDGILSLLGNKKICTGSPPLKMIHLVTVLSYRGTEKVT